MAAASERRLLPPRTARHQANLNLQYADDNEDEFPEEIAGDDVAVNAPDDENIVISMIESPFDDNDEELDSSIIVDMNLEEREDDSDEDDSVAVNIPLSTANDQEWNLQTAQRHPPGRRSAHNIFRSPHVGFATGFHPESPCEAFKAFFGNCLDITLLHTNREGRRIAATKHVQWKSVSNIELEAFIGLHLIAGALKAGHRDTRELWDSKNGNPIFRATMSYQRFQQIKAALRFDNKTRRDVNDPLAPIREVVDLFNCNMRRLYDPGSLLCIDEQLVEYHGRVRFKQYIPSKPGKFGIKIFWITDTENSFPLRCLVYIGKDTLPSDCREGSVSEAVVMYLARPYLGVGRNITMDNWFTSIDLCNRLEAENTSVVGTLRSNRRGIPYEARSIQGRRKGDSKHFISGNKMLCSYWDKSNVPVLLLSTKHSHGLHPEGEKPEIVSCYNATKSGVDNLDKLVRTYRSQRKCRRWPYGVFMTLIDVSVIAAMKSMAAPNHYKFKMDLGYEMALPLVRQRSCHPRLTRAIKMAMHLIGIEGTSVLTSTESNNQRRRCKTCQDSGRKDRKTRFQCFECKIPICNEHSKIVYYCFQCSRLLID